MTNSKGRTPMKHSIVTLLLMMICCLGAQSLYALPTKPFKKCPDCRGRGLVETWYGGIEKCDNCDGDGEVCDWVFFMLIALFAISAWGGKSKL